MPFPLLPIIAIAASIFAGKKIYDYFNEKPDEAEIYNNISEYEKKVAEIKENLIKTAAKWTYVLEKAKSDPKTLYVFNLEELKQKLEKGKKMEKNAPNTGLKIACNELNTVMEEVVNLYEKVIQDDKKSTENQDKNGFNLDEDSSWEDIVNELKSMQDLLHETLDVMEENEQKSKIAITVLKDIISQIKENPKVIENIPLETVEEFRQMLKDLNETEKNDAVSIGLKEEIALITEFFELWDKYFK